LSQDKVDDWRKLLSQILPSSDLREEIAKEIGINEVTLTRWISGISTPRVQNLKLLLQTKTIAPYRNTLVDLLQKAFPTEDFTSDPSDMITELASEDYAFILNNLATLAPGLRTWTMCELIFDRIARQFDHPGLVLLIVQCEEPSSSGKITRLQEKLIYSDSLVRLATSGYLLGAESIAGRAIQELSLIVNQGQDNLFISHQLSQKFQSIVALPLKRDGMVAGCLMVCSPIIQYFSRMRLILLKKYADLLALAFRDKHFYSPDMIELDSILPGEIQKDAVEFYADILAEYLSTHQQGPIMLTQVKLFMHDWMKNRIEEKDGRE
jgi:transcriptional regulator with XRE-family HTH domain